MMMSMKHAVFIAIVLLALITPPRNGVQAADFDANAAQKLIDSITSDPAVPGAVLYISSPEGVQTLTSGYAVRDAKTPITADHGFYIASLSKMMTAVVTYKLAEDGQIALDAPLSDYIDETFGGELANFYDVTIEQVLGHKDGMVDYLTQGYYDHAAGFPGFEASNPVDAVALALHKPALFEPGTEYAYGSTGYVLLGMMIESVTGADVQTVFADYIFEPLGMTHTAFGSHPVPEYMARGYADTNGDCDTSWHSNMPQCMEDVTDIDWGDKLTDGGIISTAADIDTFMRALLADKTLLSKDSFDHMLTTTELLAFEEYAGRGVTITQKPYGKSIGHLGHYPGYRSAALYFPERDMTMVVWFNGMFNMEHKFMHRIGDFLGDVETKAGQD